MQEFNIQALTTEDYISLYNSVGWKAPSADQVALALEHSNFTICVKDGGKPVGMGRAIGDCAISYFIKDVAVLPDYQGRGIGSMIVNSILGHIKHSVPEGFGVSVELISSEGKEPFYEKFAFGKKPGNGMGHGMMAWAVGEKTEQQIKER